MVSPAYDVAEQAGHRACASGRSVVHSASVCQILQHMIEIVAEEQGVKGRTVWCIALQQLEAAIHSNVCVYTVQKLPSHLLRCGLATFGVTCRLACDFISTQHTIVLIPWLQIDNATCDLDALS